LRRSERFEGYDCKGIDTLALFIVFLTPGFFETVCTMCGSDSFIILCTLFFALLIACFCSWMYFETVFLVLESFRVFPTPGVFILILSFFLGSSATPITQNSNN